METIDIKWEGHILDVDYDQRTFDVHLKSISDDSPDEFAIILIDKIKCDEADIEVGRLFYWTIGSCDGKSFSKFEFKKPVEFTDEQIRKIDKEASELYNFFKEASMVAFSDLKIGDVFSIRFDIYPYADECVKITDKEYYDFNHKEIKEYKDHIGYERTYVSLDIYSYNCNLIEDLEKIKIGKKFFSFEKAMEWYFKIEPIGDKWGNLFVAVNDIGQLLTLEDLKHKKYIVGRGKYSDF